MKLKTFFGVIFSFILLVSINGNTKTNNWNKFGSSWKIENSNATNLSGYPSSWGYYELTNYNTLMSIKSFNNYSEIITICNIIERTESPSEFLIAFNVKSESQQWYYHTYAFKITGGYWGMNKASLTFSDISDKTKPYNTKNNIFVKELASTDCKIKYGKVYIYRIIFENKHVILFINNEKILSAPFPEANHDGIIAVSSKNVKIALDKITLKNNDKIIFEDDFIENTIDVKTIKATRESNSLTETNKKPE
ncbi:MAG: hypothetical protein CVV49_21405 [Spirochaetae bacterium HGW-Spirochaetae-5]|nr:MAG: hypothetical protein CVV49_21405 [Spirochaetae bacterium HGW-Spirochaetae-5]